jgi:hypothetical protein
MACHMTKPQSAPESTNSAKNTQKPPMAAWAVLLPAQKQYTAVVMPSASPTVTWSVTDTIRGRAPPCKRVRRPSPTAERPCFRSTLQA